MISINKNQASREAPLQKLLNFISGFTNKFFDWSDKKLPQIILQNVKVHSLWCVHTMPHGRIQ